MSLCQIIEAELADVLQTCRISMRRLLQLHVRVRTMVKQLHGTESLRSMSEEALNDEMKFYLKAMQDEIDRLSDRGCVINNVTDGVVRIHTTFQGEALCVYWDAERDAIVQWRFDNEDIADRKIFSEQELAYHFALLDA